MLSRSKFFLVISLLILGACESKEQRLENFYESGKAYFDKGLVAEAKIEYSNALKINPRHLATLVGMRDVYKDQREPKQLYRVLHQILEVDQTNVSARKDLANLLIVADQLDEALKHSEMLLTHAAQDPETYVIRAATLLKLEDFEGGIQAARTALDFDEQNVDASYLLAWHYAKVGDHENALASVNDALSHSPKNMQLNALKVQTFNALDEIDKAIDVMNELVSQNPDNAVLTSALAKQYIQAGNNEKAERALFAQVTNHPTDAAILNYAAFLNTYKGLSFAQEQLAALEGGPADKPALKLALAELYLESDKLSKAEALMQKLMRASSENKDSVEARHVLAFIAKKRGDNEKAAQLIDEILAIDAQNTRAILAKADRLIVVKNYDKAISVLRTSLLYSPNKPDIHLYLGRVHGLRGDDALAQDHYSRALQYGRKNLAVIGGYAAHLLKTGKSDYAEGILEEALTRFEGNERLLHLLAQVKLNLGKWDEAEGIADTLEALDNKTVLSSQIRGLVYTAQSDFDRGIEAFQLAQSQQPNEFKPMASLVGVYLRAGKRDEAEAFLNSVISLNDKNLNALVLLGSVYEFFREETKAEQTYRKTIALAPKRVDLHLKLIRMFMRAKSFEKAYNATLQGLEQFPEQKALTITKAQIEEVLGDKVKAIDTYRKLLAYDDKVDIAANNLALLLLDTGGSAELNEAVTLVERFRQSKIPHFLDTLGWIYFHANKSAESLFFLERAVKELPNVAEVRYHIGVAYLSEARNIEAKRELDAAIGGASGGEPWLADAREKRSSLPD